MFRKTALVLFSAAGLAVLGYIAMATTMVMNAEPGTVLTMAASEKLPLTARLIADWRVQSWEGCPPARRGLTPLGQTLRGYGLEGFGNDRVLRTASSLLAIGCDINERNTMGQAPIHEAVLYNEPEVVRFLLAHGADPTLTISMPQQSTSPLMRHYAGMDAARFAAELDARAGDEAARNEIVTMLRTRS